MFTGALNQKALSWLKEQRSFFAGRETVVGCSGSFSTELMLLRMGQSGGGASAVHGNDVSLFSYVLGEYLCGHDNYAARPREDAPEWFKREWGGGSRGVAVLHVMLDMLAFVKQTNPHNVRMWRGYVGQFGDLVSSTEENVANLPRSMNSFTFGDVFDHFKAHDVPGAVFVCYAPTVPGVYEKIYAPFNQFIEWTPPAYKLLTEADRDALLAWCREGRKYVWYDDRTFATEAPVLMQESPGTKTVYLYSNLIEKTGYFGAFARRAGLPLPLANEDTILTADMKVELLPIKTSDLADYKDQFLAKGINHSMGMWAFAVVVGNQVVGFIEYTRSQFGLNEIYINSDFPVPNTRYTRLSKLIVMLLICGDMHRILERKLMQRCYSATSTAFTERAVSMKYRGVFDVAKRGVKKDTGRHYINYEAKFTTLTAQETYEQWMKKHGSKTRSATSTQPSTE